MSLCPSACRLPRLCLPLCHLRVLCVLLLVGFAIGCGGGNSGQRVSGKVTFAGSPVPAGKVYFRPDTSKGNSGITGYADIRDGSFDTSLEGGQGAPSGPVIIMVEGNDPKAADPKASADVTSKMLFSGYEVAVELPKTASTRDIDVPASAAKGPAAPKASNIIIP